MYRILLQLSAATSSRPASYQWLTEDGNTAWETEREDEALSRFCKELDNYKRSVLKVCKLVDIKCTCEDSESIDEYMDINESALVVEQNDSSKLVIKFDLCKAGITDYIVGYIDEDVKNEFIKTLESKGCTEVTIHPCEGIQATQEKALEGTITLPQGLLRLYSTTNRQDNYLSNAITKTVSEVLP